MRGTTLALLFAALGLLALAGTPACAMSGLEEGEALDDVADADEDTPEPDEAVASDGLSGTLRDAAITPSWRWHGRAERVMNHSTLRAAYRAMGYTPPSGAEIYAARIVPGVGQPAFMMFDAGGGAFSSDFWPASSVKLLATLGALGLVRAHGMTGDATVAFDGGPTERLRDIYTRAIRYSSNVDYDRLVQIADVDWLNDRFLVATRGFPGMVIQRAYSSAGVRYSPGMTLREDGRRVRLDARWARNVDRCPPRYGNCATPFELAEAVRRVALSEVVPAADRFDLAPQDLTGVRSALCSATPSFFADGVRRALGAGARICHKPGWVPGIDYLDAAFIQRDGQRYLIAATVPDRGASQAQLASIAEHTIRALRTREGVTLQRNDGIAIAVELDDQGSPAAGRRTYEITVEAPSADRVEIFTDASKTAEVSGTGPFFRWRHTYTVLGERLVVVRAWRGDSLIGYRSLRVRLRNAG